MLKYILISFLIITNVHAYTCEEMGYTKSIADCPDGGLKCPAEPEKMFCCDRCGDGRAYAYDDNNCSPNDGLQLAGIECGGKWTECRQCNSQYKYNNNNCRAPKILAGLQCGNAYTQCVYPTGIGCVPTVGYIYYSDGSCHADYDDTKNPVGIIVDAANKLIISFDEGQIAWNDETDQWSDVEDLKNYDVVANALLDTEGQANTYKIVAFSLSSGQEHKAAQRCASKIDGNKNWYLPSLNELGVLYNNIDDIKNGLSKVPKASMLKESNYWSSLENRIAYAWVFNISSGSIVYKLKNSNCFVRCFAHF